MSTDPSLATAADYADALLTARRAKNILLLVVVLMLLVQLAIFFTAKYTDIVIPLSDAATRPANAPKWFDAMHYFLGVSIFLGLVCSLMLTMVLYLIVKIMLVGRLIGVARVTSAFVWSLLLIILLFPWQAFMQNASFTSREFILPGILYTWDELLNSVAIGTRGGHPSMNVLILHWARFVVWPVIALVLLLVVHARSNRGMRQALGEDEIHDLQA